MNELDELWSAKLANAADNIRSTGKGGLADYIELKAANDAVRLAECEKLFKKFIDAALTAENVERHVNVEHESPHSFQHRNATMKGVLLRLSRGVRCLTLEAGWARTPSDGFMRLGALVFARITHFGMSEKNEELILKSNDDNVLWSIVKQEKIVDNFIEADIARHIRTFLDDSVR
jgi:hypothetical protein